MEALATAFSEGLFNDCSLPKAQELQKKAMRKVWTPHMQLLGWSCFNGSPHLTLSAAAHYLAALHLYCNGLDVSWTPLLWSRQWPNCVSGGRPVELLQLAFSLCLHCSGIAYGVEQYLRVPSLDAETAELGVLRWQPTISASTLRL